MMKKYEVSGIILDKNDFGKRFERVVFASNREEAGKDAMRTLRLYRGDIVRDVQITEIQ